jgi:hypothetical protein
METKNAARPDLLWENDSLLPIREAYEWKQQRAGRCVGRKESCFQFVKRMNGKDV